MPVKAKKMPACPPPPQKKPGATGKPLHTNERDTDQLLTGNPVVEMEQRLMGL